MLFDTPLLNVQSEPVADSTSSAAQAKKRKRSNSSTSNGKDELAQKGAVNLEKLMKTMKKIDGASSGSNMTPIGVRGEGGAVGNQGKGKGKAKGKNDTKGKGKGKGNAQADDRGEERESGQGKSKKQKQQPQKKTDSTPSKPSQSSSLLRPTSPVPSGTPSKPFLHSAPNASSTGQSTAAPQTAMQAQLRAKLAGGKFRMLNETLYTTSGQDAWNLMKEEGAFDDYHSGFRSQASNWPVNPLSVISNSLLSSLPANSLVADFGCGDAGLARTLSPPSSSSSNIGASLKLKLAQPKLVAQKALKVVSFDLVSQNPYVIEAECSSVPLPGSPFNSSEGQVVDAVVCCLSLMGTDWINMIREARRVLKTDGKLLIAEVTSRFEKVEEFVKLVESVGFESTGKDDSNSHFVLFDFVKSSTSTEQVNEAKKNENTRKGSTLLKPCIYKKR